MSVAQSYRWQRGSSSSTVLLAARTTSASNSCYLPALDNRKPLAHRQRVQLALRLLARARKIRRQLSKRWLLDQPPSAIDRSMAAGGRPPASQLEAGWFTDLPDWLLLLLAPFGFLFVSRWISLSVSEESELPDAGE